MTKAKGTFQVKMVPQPPDDNVGDPAIGRMALDKMFDGDLAGVSKGQMLAAQSDVQGSAGYVAIEKFTGTLGGKEGTLMLQHFGLMQGSDSELRINVIPDSGTGELKGISGSLNIIISGGEHAYEFDYTFEAE